MPPRHPVALLLAATALAAVAGCGSAPGTVLDTQQAAGPAAAKSADRKSVV